MTEVGNVTELQRFMKRRVNLYYECAAVAQVLTDQREPRLHHWEVQLHEGNDPGWIEPHLPDILDTARDTRRRARLSLPQSLTVTAPGKVSATYRVPKGA